MASLNNSVELRFAQGDDLALPLSAARESFVATRGAVPPLKAGGTQGQTRSYHVAQDNIASLCAVFPNFYVPSSSSVETGPGAAATITASVEYPIGSARQQLKFSGLAQGSIPNNGMVFSDYLTLAVSIPKGEPFRLWHYRTCASGLPYGATQQAPMLGEGAQFGGSVADVTMSGAIGGSDSGSVYGPIAILGQTKQRTVAILSDSIDWGDGDRFNSYFGDLGVLARSIGPYYAYSKLATPGDSAVEFVASHDNRLAIAQYASDIIIGYGTNDLPTRTDAQINADMLTIAGYFGVGKNLYSRTITPITTSTDNWATIANQTADFKSVAAASVNATRMSNPAPFVGCFDVAGVMSGAYGVHRWLCDTGPVAFYATKDGTHPVERMYKAVQDSGIVRLKKMSA